MFDFSDPQVNFAIGMAIAGLIGSITALVAAVAFFLRTNSKIREMREERETKNQQTVNEIQLLNAKRINQEEQHRRDLELMRTQVTLEREQQARQQEQDLEKRLTELMEVRIKELANQLNAITAERDDMKRKTEEQQAELEQLQQQYDTLSRDFTALKMVFEESQQREAKYKAERDSLMEENRALRKRVEKMDKMSEDLEAMRTTVAEQQRQIRALEDAANGHNEYDDDPVETQPS